MRRHKLNMRRIDMVFFANLIMLGGLSGWIPSEAICEAAGISHHILAGIVKRYSDLLFVKETRGRNMYRFTPEGYLQMDAQGWIEEYHNSINRRG